MNTVRTHAHAPTHCQHCRASPWHPGTIIPLLLPGDWWLVAAASRWVQERGGWCTRERVRERKREREREASLPASHRVFYWSEYHINANMKQRI